MAQSEPVAISISHKASSTAFQRDLANTQLSLIWAQYDNYPPDQQREADQLITRLYELIESLDS